jgi:non-specific serine/threonine protein kinase/serine/threonine-protein kinase
MRPERLMTGADWARLQEVFQAACDLPADARPGFLTEACAGQPWLRTQVESLLQAVEADSVLSLAVRHAVESTASEPALGERIGAYEVIQLLGRGGMGIVFLAARADDEFRRQVAVKLVRPGWDSVPLLARFRAERQILADLDHPNIARLLDGGATPAGQPYLVMEYVPGVTIDRYCRDHDLPVAARLHLFLQVCDAVSHAHRKLIVHRDIKPGNTLVTEEGTVKLLDFGIAKLLPAGEAAAGALPSATELLLTPEYASPEQLRGERLTIASDLFSLGVLLYELLSESYPFAADRGSPLNLQAAICGREPPRPSSAAPPKRAIGRELDAITLKAMRKEPASRYASVDALAEDIRRHLSGYPVMAAAGSRQYRAGKFLRRNKWAVAAGLVASALISSWILSLRAEQARTMRRAAQVRDMATSFLFEFHDAVRDLPGSIGARKRLVERGLRYLDELAKDAPNDHSLQAELADGYLRIADIQYHAGLPSLRDIPGAIQSIRKANLLRRQLIRESPAVEQRIKLAFGLGRLAEAVDEVSKNPAEYETIARQGLDILNNLPPEARARGDAVRETAALLFGLGAKRLQAGDPAAAAESFRKAIALREQLVLADAEDFDLQLDLAWTYDQLADALGGVTAKVNLKQPEQALLAYSKAQSLFEDLIRRRPNDLRSQTLLAAVFLKQSVVMRFQGRNKIADGLQDNALAWFRTAAAADPNDRETKRYLGIIYNDVGLTRLSRKDFPGAQQAIEQSLRIREGLLHEHPEDTRARLDLASGDQSYAEYWLAMGRPRQAEAESRQAIQIRAPLLQQDPANAAILVRQANAYGILGRALLAEGQWRACRDAFATSLSYFEPLRKAGALSVEYAETPARVGKDLEVCSRAAGRQPGPESKP